jgi:hypothetical protein
VLLTSKIQETAKAMPDDKKLLGKRSCAYVCHKRTMTVTPLTVMGMIAMEKRRDEKTDMCTIAQALSVASTPPVREDDARV